jgi:hypothetical protein
MNERGTYVLSMFIELGKNHFCKMSERTLHYWTENVSAKCPKNRKASMELWKCMLVSWLVK